MKTISFTFVLESLRTRIRAESAWFGNTAILTAGNLITAALGFAYWWIAAHYFAPDTVGYAAALISLIGLVGVISESGIGTYLMGNIELEAGKGLERLASAALLSSVAVSILCGSAAIAAFSFLGTKLQWIRGDGTLTSLILLGCSAAVASYIIDHIYLGFFKSYLSFYRNASFAILKLLLIVAAALHAGFSQSVAAVVASWVTGSVLSVAFLLFFCPGRLQLSGAPNFRWLLRSYKKILSHHALNLSNQIPALALPLVTVTVIGPEQNAAFYSLWTILNVLLFAPAALTTVLYTVVSRQPGTQAPRVATSLFLCSIMGLAVSVVYLLGSQQLLGLFNRSYIEFAQNDLRFLGVGFFAIAIKYHYIAVSRLNDSMLQSSAYLALGGAAEVVFATVGGYLGELMGLTFGWLIAVFVQAVLMALPLSQIIRAPAGRVTRHAEPGGVTG